MTFTPIERGLDPWDEAVNGAFEDLQTQISSGVVPSTDNLIAPTPFYVAHRGSGGEGPELTAEAYTQVVGAGATAIEISCQLSADGILYAFHDTTMDRMTNSTWTGSSAPWEISALRQQAKIVGTPLLGPGWANQTIPTVKELLDRYLGKVVIFIEAKTSAATVPLQELLLSYSLSTVQKSVVWKMYYQNNSGPWAIANGIRVWSYVDVGTTQAQMDTYDANATYWGVPIEAPDAQFTATVARGKKVISWEVHRRSEVTRLVGLGVSGMMASQWNYLQKTLPVNTADQFLKQVKSPGEIGAAHSDPLFAMKWDAVASNNAVYCNKTGGAAINLGSFCPVQPGAAGYKVAFDMYWPGLPTGTLHAGFYFSQVDDSKHTFGVANAQGCYRMELRPNSGAMQLYTVAPGATSGVQVGSDVTTSGALSATTWYSYEFEVNPTSVVLRRTDSTGWSGMFANTVYRGGYFGFHNGSLTDVTTLPRFRNIVVTAL